MRFLRLPFFALSIGFILLGYQNCSNVNFEKAEVAGMQSLSSCLAGQSCESLACSFNGASVPHGATVLAFLASTGVTCQSEQRVCNNGLLSGSYQYPSCTPQGPASCLFNGQTVAHGASVTAYLSSSGTTCVSETRTCSNGNLSGSYAYASCMPEAPAACLFNGQTIPSGQSVVAYQNGSVPFGSTCVNQVRVCTNGSLSGTYNYSSCVVNAAASCLFNGQTIPHGGSLTAYLQSTVPFGSSCQSQTRTCQNGELTGTYGYGSCSVGEPAACLFDGKTVAHGAQVTAYQNSSVPFGSNCQAEQRLCQNGSLQGSFNFPTCSPQAPRSCNFNGRVLAHGERVSAFQASSVPFGGTCLSQERVCSDGTLSGSYTFDSCSPQAPASCQFNGQNIAHGASVVAYPVSSVAFGSTCSSETRVCTNGNLSGSAAYATCSVAQPASCLFGNRTLAHGEQVTAFRRVTADGSISCQSETRTCSNGNLSGSYADESCVACPGGGVHRGGACWYLGSAGQSCASVCSSRGGFHLATQNFAGGGDAQGASHANCTSIMQTLGLPYQGTHSPSPTACNQHFYGMGCTSIPYPGSTDYVRCSNQSTTAEASYPGGRRACACNQ